VTSNDFGSRRLSGREHDLVNRRRRRWRIKRAARRVDFDAAANAYLAFTDEEEPIELTIGRVLVLLDDAHLLEEQ
jgi:hypothetical protein